MHDKLDIIWDKKAAKPQSSNQEEINNMNMYFVKKEIESKKAMRNFKNKQQIKAYNKMLSYIDQRQEMNHNIDVISKKIFVNEKEREFFDCIRLII